MTINSNFSTINHPNLSYTRNELDHIDQNEKNPTVFRMTIEIIHPSNTEDLQNEDFLTEQLNKTLKQPLTLFGDEQQQLPPTISDNDPSSVMDHRRKSKDGSMSLISTSPTSPGFTNPIRRHPLLPQYQQSEFFSSSINDVPLLDLEEEENLSNIESISSPTHPPSVNLLDDDFNFDLTNPTTPIISPTPAPISIPKVEEKSSSKIYSIEVALV